MDHGEHIGSILTAADLPTAPQVLAQNDSSSQLAVGIYFGVVLVMALFNLFLFWSNRNKTHIYYVLFITAVALFTIAYRGLINDYLPISFPWFAKSSPLLFSATACVLASSFTTSFFKTKIEFPLLHKVLVATATCFGAMFALSITGLDALIVKMPFVLTTVLGLLLTGIGYYIQRNGVSFARFYLFAWIALFCGSLLQVGELFGYFPSVFITHYGVELGSILCTVMLSLALSDSITFFTKAKERAQQRTIESLEQADRIKNEFLATTGQDLRRPIHSVVNVPEWIIDGFAPVMCVVCSSCEESFETETPQDVSKIESCPECGAKNTLEYKELDVYHRDVAEIKTVLQTVLKAGFKLRTTVNDLISFSNLQTGKSNLELEQVGLVHFVYEVANRLGSIAKVRKVNIDTSSVPVDLSVTMDRKKIAQVLFILGNHAIQSSPEGETVRLQAESRNEGVLFSVHDNGARIPKAQRKLLFQNFEHSSPDSEGHSTRTRLGFALAKNLVELHKGKIWVESKAGKGNVFFVELRSFS